MKPSTTRVNNRGHDHALPKAYIANRFNSTCLSGSKEGWVMTEEEKQNLESFGFRLNRSGGHSARTIMVDELELLFSYVDDVDSPKQAYIDAIVADNCLGKPSKNSQIITSQIITTMYGFDPDIPLFRLLRFFWARDAQGHALLAALCAYARDPIFRMSVPYVLNVAKGASVSRSILEEFIESQEPGRYSATTRASVAKNLNSSWTQTGHFVGRGSKHRVEAKPTAASAAYAIIIAIMLGHRGRALFDSEPVRMLDCSAGRAMELAQLASEKGWLVFKRIGEIVEVQIPDTFGFLKDGGIA